MATHSFHPSIGEAGLADECPRCAEISVDPFVGLDDHNLSLIVIRTKAWMRDKEFPRSETEMKAMRIVEKTLRSCSRLKELGLL